MIPAQCPVLTRWSRTKVATAVTLRARIQTMGSLPDYSTATRAVISETVVICVKCTTTQSVNV